MGYTIHLTNVMRGIFQPLEGKAVGEQSIEEEITSDVVAAYKSSHTISQIHNNIQLFANNVRAWEAADNNHVLEEIIRLINEYTFPLRVRQKSTSQV